MADNTPPNQAQPGQDGQAQGQVVIQNLYVKDVSFETPSSPQIFLELAQSPGSSTMEHNFNSGVRVLAENTYEVVLGATVTVKLKDKTAFLVEVQQAGIFTIAGFNKDQINFLVNTFCLNTLFPYLRENVSSLVVRGGFPALLLPPINFEARPAQDGTASQPQAGEVSTSPVT